MNDQNHCVDNSFRRVESLRQLKDFDRAFNESFSLVAYIANRFFIDHLLRAGRQLTDNDYESLVIWGVLAHQNVASLMPPGSIPTAVLSERGLLRGGEKSFKPLKLRDISAITGVPRETARRKLLVLEKKRFVSRVPEGWIVIGERVESDLRDFTRGTVIRLASACDEMLFALRDIDKRSSR